MHPAWESWPNYCDNDPFWRFSINIRTIETTLVSIAFEGIRFEKAVVLIKRQITATWHRCAISVFHGSWNVPVKNTVALNGALTTGSVDKTRGSRTRFNETPERTRCTAVRNTRVITHLMLIMPIAGRDCFILVRPIRLTISDRVWLSTGCERLTKSSPVPAPVLYNEHACSTASIRETERSGKSNRDLG